MTVIKVPERHERYNDWELGRILRRRLRYPEYFMERYPNEVNVMIEDVPDLKSIGNHDLGRLMKSLIYNRLDAIKKRGKKYQEEVAE